MVAFFGFSLLSLALPILTFAEPHGHAHVHRHKVIAARVKGDMQLHKRFSGTRWTFYDVGLGACGKYNVASDFIVALNSAQYGGGYPGPNCFKSITMTYNGKTAQATIMDECPGCPYGGLDLSRGLFAHFGSLDEGVLTGEWHFNDGSGGGSSGGNDEPKPKPKTTTTKQQPKTTQPPPPPPETTTTTHRKTSTTKQEEPTTTSSRSTSSTHSTTTSSSSVPSSSASSSSVLPSVNYSSGVASGLAVPTGVVQSTSENPQVINNLGQAVIYAGALIAAFAKNN